MAKMKFALLYIIVLSMTISVAVADTVREVEYELNRVIQVTNKGNVEVVDPNGFALVEDTGPYTPMTRVAISARACDGLYFSPQPECDPVSLEIDGNAAYYSFGGEVYELENGRDITVIRRGSVETGDPSLILAIDGFTLIFAEVR